MPLTLEKYAEFLDNRGEPRPAGPDPVPFPNARPFLRSMPTVRTVIYSGYGTLLLITGGELFLLNPDPIMRTISLEKTIHEFKMWASMTRKPGNPSEYMASIFRQVHDNLLIREYAYPDAEPRLERVWEGILQRLFQKEYVYDVAFYGGLGDYTKKISYYYLLASQGVSVFADALATLRRLAQAGVRQAIHANGQCPSPVMLWRLLGAQGPLRSLDELFDPELNLWSYALGVRKQSQRGMQSLVRSLKVKGIEPETALYVGSSVEEDIVPAKRHGFRTALLLADKNSAKAKKGDLKDERRRPDCLLTELAQLGEVVVVR